MDVITTEPSERIVNLITVNIKQLIDGQVLHTFPSEGLAYFGFFSVTL
jgi:hypothetical protein